MADNDMQAEAIKIETAALKNEIGRLIEESLEQMEAEVRSHLIVGYKIKVGLRHTVHSGYHV